MQNNMIEIEEPKSPQRYRRSVPKMPPTPYHKRIIERIEDDENEQVSLLRKKSRRRLIFESEPEI